VTQVTPAQTFDVPLYPYPRVMRVYETRMAIPAFADAHPSKLPDADGKQPYAIALADRGLMALAGLWETWRSPAGERVRSFAIITTTPNELCAELHDRMPVVLGPQVWPAMVGRETGRPSTSEGLALSVSAEEMACWPVSTRAGNVKNNDPNLIEPVAFGA
jgi:putative SOS response-associated peptidase YedK